MFLNKQEMELFLSSLIRREVKKEIIKTEKRMREEKLKLKMEM